MQLTIQIPKHYYELGDETYDSHSEDFRPQRILEVAQTDWKEFAFDMADVIETELQKQV